MNKKASIHTLGCRLNQADAALIAGALVEAGFEMVPWGKPADLIVVNSCTVTGSAAQKTRQAARTARRKNPHAYIVLAGCEVNVGSSDWEALEVVDQVIPNPDKMLLVDLLPENAQSGERESSRKISNEDGFVLPGTGYYSNKTRANLKIQEGCDCFCSYCIVPYARGRSRSRDWDDILRETENLVAAGHKEIVLTGVNIAKFSSGERRLPELISALLEVAPDFRLRLSSTELCPEVEAIVEQMKVEPRICRFLHLPIQHGEDSILKAMKRPYSVAEFAETVLKAAHAVPGLCLGSDVIVGFPGETDTQFEGCCKTVENLPFSFLHVFRYSPRPGTPAAEMEGRIHGDIVSERARRLATLGKKKAAQFAQSQVGKTLRVLTENTNVRGRREGWTDNYLRVELDAAGIPRNIMVSAQITEVIEGRYVKGVSGSNSNLLSS